MNTGIYKLAGALLLLAGCGEGLELSLPKSGAAPTKTLREVPMARGAVTIAAPDGYCVDPGSLKSNFAVMARCDTLKAEAGTAGAPLGVVTVGISKAGPGLTLEEHLQGSLAGDTVLSRRKIDGGLLVRLEAASPPREGLSRTYWRGVGQVGDRTIGAALYGAPDAAVTQSEGGDILESVIRRAKATSGSKKIVKSKAKPKTKDTKPKKGLGGVISGLFD